MCLGLPDGQHLLKPLVLLLELLQPPDVGVGHHPELLLPAVERLRRDVQLLADIGLAPPGLVVADRLNLGLLRGPFLAHVCRVYAVGLVVGQPPPRLTFQLAPFSVTRSLFLAMPLKNIHTPSEMRWAVVSDPAS